jgi:hypothetical protein
MTIDAALLSSLKIPKAVDPAYADVWADYLELCAAGGLRPSVRTFLGIVGRWEAKREARSELAASFRAAEEAEAVRRRAEAATRQRAKLAAQDARRLAADRQRRLADQVLTASLSAAIERSRSQARRSHWRGIW